MSLDRTTLEHQIALLSHYEENLTKGLKDRLDKAQALQIEIEQHRGAISYNQLLLQNARTELAGLPTPPPAPTTT